METMTIYREFVRCMAAFLRGDKATITLAKEEQIALAKLARRQSLSGALFAATTGLEPSIACRLQQDAVKTMSRSEEQTIAQNDIAKALSLANIPHLFFKGAVVRTYYRDPLMRSMGDIDMIVHTSDREAVRQVMASIGFERTAHTEEVWSYQRYQTLVEVHTVVKRFDTALQDTRAYDDVWQEAVVVDGATYHWRDEAEAAHCAAHLTSHFCQGGCGLRMLMDMAVLCDRFEDEAFWREVLARLAEVKTDEFARRLLWLCGEWLKVHVPASLTIPLDKETEEGFLRRLLQEGTFGTDERVLFAMMRRDHKKKRGVIARAWRRLFPPPLYLRRRYEYAQKHPWLLPIGYIHRMLDGVFKNRRIHQQRRQFAKENGHELEAEIAFFDAVGL